MEVQAIEFQKKLQELVALARTKKNILEYKELQDFFDSMSPSEQQYDRIIEYLAHKGIDVLKISDTDDDDALLLYGQRCGGGGFVRPGRDAEFRRF